MWVVGDTQPPSPAPLGWRRPRGREAKLPGSDKGPKGQQKQTTGRVRGEKQDRREQRHRSEREITRTARRGSPAPAGAQPLTGCPRPPQSLRAPGARPAPTPPCRPCPPRRAGAGGCGRASHGRPYPRSLPAPGHSHRRFPGSAAQHTTASPRRSPPLAAPLGRAGAGAGSAATAAGRAQSALSLPPSALRPLLLPRPREKRALCGEPLGEGAAAAAR